MACREPDGKQHGLYGSEQHHTEPLPPSCAPLLQNLIFRFLQSRQKIQIWLYEHNDLRIEGRIIVSASPPPAAAAATRAAAAAAHATCAAAAAHGWLALLLVLPSTRP